MRWDIWVVLLFLASPLLGSAQPYIDTPFYKLSGGSPAGAAARWSGSPTFANGTTTEITMFVNHSGGWDEGMQVDGKPGAQVLHWFAAFYKPHATFGYDLLLEPLSRTTKIRCTFSAMTEPEHGFQLRDTSSSMVPLPEPLTPLVIESGDTISIRFSPEGVPDKPFVQYLKIATKAKEEARHPQQFSIPPAVGLGNR
jgi:hypothetical protein